MRVIFRILLALVALVLVQGRALATVSSQRRPLFADNEGPFRRTAKPTSGRSPRDARVMRRRAAFSGRRALYAMVHSAKYGNAPMPHSIFFYGQYAIHGTTAVGNLGSPASHGCIRISPPTRRRCSPWCRRQGAEIRIVGSPLAAMSRARATSPRIRRWPSRRFATRGRSNEWARNPLALGGLARSRLRTD